MVLDRNPENYFAEVEQAAFEPANMVPGHRPVAGQDAARAAVQLSRHAPLPDRPELPAAADQPPAVPRPQLQQGRRDALREPRRPGLRAEHRRRAGGRRGALRRARDVAHRRRHGAHRVRRCTPRTTTSASRARSCARSCRRPTATTSSTNILGHAGDPDVTDEMKPRIVEYWTNVDADVGAAVAAGPRRLGRPRRRARRRRRGRRRGSRRLTARAPRARHVPNLQTCRAARAMFGRRGDDR